MAKYFQPEVTEQMQLHSASLENIWSLIKSFNFQTANLTMGTSSRRRVMMLELRTSEDFYWPQGQINHHLHFQGILIGIDGNIFFNFREFLAGPTHPGTRDNKL